MPLFEYDKQKSIANASKHGFDFVEAQKLWEDERFVEIPARTTEDPRYLAIGAIAGKSWSAVITFRGETIRIISVRRARIEEVEKYEG